MIDATKPIDDMLIARMRAWLVSAVPVAPNDYATARVVVACGATQATVAFTVKTTYGPSGDPDKAQRTDHTHAAVMWDAETPFSPFDLKVIQRWASRVIDMMTTDLAIAAGQGEP